MSENEKHVLGLAQAQSKLDAREWGAKVDGEYLPRWEDRDRPTQEEYLKDARNLLLLVRALGFTHPDDVVEAAAASQRLVAASREVVQRMAFAFRQWNVDPTQVVRDSLTEDGYELVVRDQGSIVGRYRVAWVNDDMRRHILEGIAPVLNLEADRA